MRLRTYQVTFERDGLEWIAYKGLYRVRIVPDERYPKMWRVVRPSGEITGMVNLTRAKDVALGMIESLEFVRAAPTAEMI
jgi:hypothetical protein